MRVAWRHRDRLGDLADWLLVIILAGWALYDVWSSGDRSIDRAAGTALVLAVIIPLAWRRRFPLAVVSVVYASLLVGTVAFDRVGTSFQPVVAAVMALYSLAAYGGGRQQLLGAAGAAAAVGTVQALVALRGDDPGVPGFDLLLVAAFLVGRVRRWQWLDSVRLRGRAAELEREREEKARAAVAEERGRIARELHDLVAHAASVIVVQARAGRRALPDEPHLARESFDAIEATGRQALEEMRRLVGLLRKDDEELALAPQPSLRHLDSLLAHVSEAGLPVQVEIQGEPKQLPPGVDLAAYRIIQEALTNAIKHAGPASAQVVLRYHPEELQVEIVDTGAGVGAEDGAGHGLVGMRERVSLYGGQLEAGRRDGEGFAVRARLPLGSTRP
jgi:signal transduction histidine kinase